MTVTQDDMSPKELTAAGTVPDLHRIPYLSVGDRTKFKANLADYTLSTKEE